MNPAEFKMRCMICSDLQTANSKIDGIENIIRHLKNYIITEEPFDNRNEPEIHVRNDSIHVHFMCGNCIEFNESKLRRANERVHELSYSFCRNIRSGKVTSNDYHSVIRILQGHYPSICRIITTVWEQEKIK